jgi:plastocyanin
MFSFHSHKKAVLWAAAAGALLFSGSACTTVTMTVHAVVQDERGNLVQDAVVYAEAPQSGIPPPVAETRKSGRGLEKRDIIDLENQAFIPLVLPVQIGTAVSFWNRDVIQYYIYSISPAKQFELTIDKDASSAPVVFDKPGVVVIGSTIHDRMIAYIYVLKTPWFARTGEDGKVDLWGLPKGTYDVRVWHPAMKGSPEATTKRVVPSSQGAASAEFVITVQSAQNPG